MALILRNGGSQSPDRWLREPRNNQYNTLLEQFDGDRDKMMAWAREQADKETKLYKEATGKISVEFSKAACIPMNERRSFNVGYLFLQELCTQLRIDKICRTIKERHKYKYNLQASNLKNHSILLNHNLLHEVFHNEYKQHLSVPVFYDNAKPSFDMSTKTIAQMCK